ncbi:MAG TPA: enolase C-terminal domain-like protein [Acidimicrobiales bacterium]|jgi:O-succinylbenzoate synthase
MRLIGVELVRVDIPFRHRIRTAVGIHGERGLLFVRVVTDQGEGWGECGALSEGTAVDPPVTAVYDAAVKVAVPRLFTASAARGGVLPSSGEVAKLFGTTPADRYLAAVFEMAVSDMELRASGQSLAEWLEVGPGFETLPVGAAVGIPEGRDVGLLLEEVTALVVAGVGRVRVKIEPGWDIEAVAALRERFGALVLQVDANGAYRVGDAEHLARLGAYDVVCLEQPLPPADLVALAEFRRRIGVAVPICLDESLSSPRRVIDAIQYEACQVACLKPARLGGLRATRVAHAACVQADVSVFIGGFFEAGLGRASNLALAARLHQEMPGLVGDLGDPAGYLSEDPCGYPVVADGWVRVPASPGVGNWPDEVTLSELGEDRQWFPATYT